MVGEDVVYLTMEYYSTMRKKEILPCLPAWMNLNDVMLSEVSQAEIDKYCMLYLYVESKNKKLKFIETESRNVVARVDL